MLFMFLPDKCRGIFVKEKRVLCKPAQVVLSHPHCQWHLTFTWAFLIFSLSLCSFGFIEIEAGAFRLNLLCSEMNVASSKASFHSLTVLHQGQRQRSSLSFTHQLLTSWFATVSVSKHLWGVKAVIISYQRVSWDLVQQRFLFCFHIININKSQIRTAGLCRPTRRWERRIKEFLQGGGWLLLIYCLSLVPSPL